MEEKKTTYDPLDLHEFVGQSGMTLGEMITSFRQAKNRRLQLHALAELTLLKEEEIKELLLTHGVSYKEFPRAPRKKNPVEVKDEDLERLQQPDPTPAPEPAAGAKKKPAPPPLPDQTIKADAGKPELRLVPWQIVRDIAEVRTYGNLKYKDPYSWRRVEPARYIDALLRHVIAFAEDPHGVDEESGIPHYKHAACNLAFLCEMMKGEK